MKSKCTTLGHVAHFMCFILCYTTSFAFSADVESALGLFENPGTFSADELLKTNDDWKKPNRFYSGHTELDYFLEKGNIANYLDLQPIDSVYLPVPINFILIGFSGNGNHGIKLSENDLRRWFEHMDHILEHTRVSADWDADSAASEDIEPRIPQMPPVSAVHYNYSVHAIDMGNQIAAVFEQAISVLARKEDPKSKRPLAESRHQVDMEGMVQIVNNLLHSLRLEDSAYNIVILNPDKANVPHSYGYRLGLSKEEFTLIVENKDVRKKLSSPALDKMQQLFETYHEDLPLFDSSQRPHHKFAWRSVQPHEVEQWATRYSKLVEGAERLVNDKRNATENALRKAQQMLTGHVPHRSRALRRAIAEGGEGGWQEECLVDTWVGSYRWAMMDLTAGPFSWGPLTGGLGARTPSSLPSVDQTFSGGSEDHLELPEEVLEQRLEDLVEERFQFLSEDSSHEVDILLAELDVYEGFFSQHCLHRTRKPLLCEEMETRLTEMKDLLSRHLDDSDVQKARLAQDALHKLHSATVFGGNRLQIPEKNVSHQWDTFLAHLGSTLSSLTQHVIVPSAQDGRYGFYEKVSFHVYLITQETYYDKRRTPFDVSALRDALASLQLPSQKFQFSTHKLSLAEDPPLALAYARALRSSMARTALPNGSYVYRERSYLDSAVLQSQLQRQLDAPPPSKPASGRKPMLEVPIFVFAVSGKALFIDRWRTAIGLEDMVIGVQLEESAFGTPLHCNGEKILQDLRNPVKALVGATLAHLGGLLPSHVTFENRHDWRWSVGAHALSCTSREHQITAFQKDALARNFVVLALEDALREVNSGIAILGKQKTHEELYRLFKRREERPLVGDYNRVVDLVRRTAAFVGELNFGEATKLLAELEQASKTFHRRAREVANEMHPLHCTKKFRPKIGVEILVVVLVFALIQGVVSLCRMRNSKPKIN